MRLTDLASACGLEFGGPASSVEITDITFDSRQAAPGVLFVALAGVRRDGHDFVPAVAAAGAAGALVAANRADEFRELGLPLLVADVPREVLGFVSAKFFDDPAQALQLIGITGTNGKTTVSYLIEAVLKRAGRRPGVIGTVNYRWPGHVEPAPNTTPESLIVQRLLARMRDDGVGTVAVEVSSHGLSTHRVRGTAFDVAVFTNLSQDHLDFHGSMDEYRAAKRRLFTEHLKPGGISVLNVDDPEGAALAELLHDAITTSASGGEAAWRCTRFEQGLEGTVIDVAHPGGTLSFTTRLLGRFNASNVLQTLAACAAIGVAPAAAAEALTELRGVPGRLQHVGGGGKPHVFVDYAHTPDALARALEALRPLATRRLVVVFGCGGDRDRAKRPLMGAVACEVADEVIITSDNPRTEDAELILDEIEPGLTGTKWKRIADRSAAIHAAIVEASPDDVILIAGKGHETYQEVYGVRRSFDDIEHATQALEDVQ